jgi:hypothetical protein
MLQMSGLENSKSNFNGVGLSPFNFVFEQEAEALSPKRGRLFGSLSYMDQELGHSTGSGIFDNQLRFRGDGPTSFADNYDV